MPGLCWVQQQAQQFAEAMRQIGRTDVDLNCDFTGQAFDAANPANNGMSLFRRIDKSLFGEAGALYEAINRYLVEHRVFAHLQAAPRARPGSRRR